MEEPDAAVAILRTRGPDPAILLIRRAEREGDSWSGHWSLPGGRREPHDADLVHTALRELHEECGIRCLAAQMSAALPVSVARRRSGPFVPVAPFVFEIDGELPACLDTSEAVEGVWMPVRALLDARRHRFQRIPGMSQQMWFPAFAMPAVPLWGFTYRLLCDWLGISRADCAAVAAQGILDCVQRHGTPLQRPWHVGHDGAQVATVDGPIPVQAVVDHLSEPGAYLGQVSAVEVDHRFVRIHGLNFEPYIIQA